jgi:3-oxoacyl-[acyl-carrier protein] reductase
MATTKRVALVTGSASGIGSTIARTLAVAGYDVVVNYSRSADAARETASACSVAESDSLLVQCDVSNETGVKAMVEEINRKYGRLDVVCNNAGTSIETLAKDFDQVSVEEFDRVLAVNVKGLFLVAKHTRALLSKGTDPCMVNMASTAGLRPGPQPLPYSASKAAVVAMTQSLCLALAPTIRVNAVAPGWIEGDWMRWMLGENYDKLMERRAKMTPLRRCVTMDDVAEVVLTLIERMHFVTGETIVVDGGFAKTT